jgi:hypothetical protein
MGNSPFPSLLPLMTYEPLWVQITHDLQAPWTTTHLWPMHPSASDALMTYRD